MSDPLYCRSDELCQAILPRRILFLCGRCVFGYGAMLDLMSWWALGRSNETYLISIVGEMRAELARGADHAAVVRSLMSLYAGVELATVVAATRKYLRHASCRSPALGRARAMVAATASGVEAVLVSDLALFSLADEVPGVDSLLSSVPACVSGQLTGEIDLLAEGAGHRRALVQFAETRDVRAADCLFWHCAGPGGA